MQIVLDTADVITASGVIVGALVTIITIFVLVIRGIKCLMRSEMLRIYYHNENNETIRQYEFENFCLLYKAYKALRGNSFIDEIFAKVKTWEIVT